SSALTIVDGGEGLLQRAVRRLERGDLLGRRQAGGAVEDLEGGVDPRVPGAGTRGRLLTGARLVRARPIRSRLVGSWLAGCRRGRHGRRPGLGAGHRAPPGAFLATAFFATAFLATAFLATAFFAMVFFATAFFAAADLAAAFFA